MRSFFRHHALSILAANISLLLIPSLRAQWSTNVSSADELTAAFAQAFSNSVADSTTVNTINLTDNISSTNQWIVDANVNIVGNGNVINMNNADRAFFIAGGTVSIANLSVQNGKASGGTGGNGGGGGAGLGGAIFVGSGTYSAADGSVGALGLSTPKVTLNNVNLMGNQAIGGNSPIVQGLNAIGGGAGGMGGAGGSTLLYNGLSGTGGGGGGFGNASTGGNSTILAVVPGGTGALVNVIGTNTSGGNGGGGSEGGAVSGGMNGGGGGGGQGGGNGGSGGGGGGGGERGYYQNSSPPNNGGNGGFGGGGGGGEYYTGGNGGFGGGGGAGFGFSITSDGYGGTGGFGGGGGGVSMGNLSGGPGGFGGGHGANASGVGGGGGGGLGAGGSIFVMSGASVTIQGGIFSNNSVASGIGYYSGSSYGADLFLGTDVTFNVTNGTSLTVSSLGGAGNTNDPNVAQSANDPNAQGGVIKTGEGTLTMTGSNYYTGATLIHQGTLALGAGALEQGTSQIIVGQNSGDNATLALGSNTTLNVFYGTNPAVILGQNAGSTGMVIIGNGAGSSGTNIGANEFNGGIGGGIVVFRAEYAAGSNAPSVNPFYTVLTGNLQVVQDGPGVTSINVACSYTGKTLIQEGTLMTAVSGALGFLGGTTNVTVATGGTLALGASNSINADASLSLNGGMLKTISNLSQILGAWSLLNSSTLDFGGYAASLTFTSLSINGALAIWNWNPTNDSIFINGAADASYSDITFYSDSGTTVLGTGAIRNGQLEAVPEPSTWALLGLGAVAVAVIARRRKSLQS